MKRALVLLAFLSLSCGHYEDTLKVPSIDHQAEWAKKVESFKRELEPHRAEIRDAVSRCSSEAELGITYRVDYLSTEICRKPVKVRGNQVRYTVARGTEGKAVILLSLGMELRSPSGRNRELEILEMVRSCIPHAKTLFERYGINFELTMDEFTPDSNYDSVVKLIDSDDAPMNSSSWRIHPESHGDFTAETCGNFFHEIGHLLGGSDEYLDTTCPDREYVETSTFPYSIMGRNANFENTDFYSRHIKDMIRPLCEDLAARQNWPKQLRYDFRQM
ncbi:MAG: hypothetical protein ABIQ95_00315 [Bdellovibrionia bacterium]